MPRKNARPAARKEAAKRKARIEAAKAKPRRRVGVIAHHHPGGASLAMLALLAHRLDQSS